MFQQSARTAPDIDEERGGRGVEETTFPVLPFTSCKIVATTGAGDSFVGCFMARYLSANMAKTPRALEEAVAAGMRCSRVSLRTEGINLDQAQYVDKGRS